MVEKEEKAFRKLLVWKRAHELTLMIYKITETFPKHELFALTNQVRRSVVSVEANIAEGYALGTAPNYLRHLNISIGSLAETECHLEIAHDLGYFSDSSYESLAGKFREVGYLLSRLKASIEHNNHQKP
ncbi:MAG: four helix bundle protein [Chloroflexi bacterium]|nr:four helix bundle protein [Chloroflexota bacterium]